MGVRTVGQSLREAVLIDGAITLQEASASMLDAGAVAAIVLSCGRPVGLITAEDIARGLGEGHDTERTAAIVLADRDPLLARADEPLVDAHQRMREQQRDLALVVDGDGAPLGLLGLF